MRECATRCRRSCKRDHDIHVAATGEEALAFLKKNDVDLMLLDVRLPGINGLEILKIVRENYTLVEVIMVSAVSEVEVSVQAMKHGAYHYITKEFDYDGLRSLVRNALERQDLSRQVISLSAQVADQDDRDFILGPSHVMQEIVDLAHKVAKLPATILILGESGTGKELLARLLHRESGRSPAPFIPVNSISRRSPASWSRAPCLATSVARLRALSSSSSANSSLPPTALSSSMRSATSVSNSRRSC